jgi:hypothetical protein
MILSVSAKILSSHSDGKTQIEGVSEKSSEADKSQTDEVIND